MLCEKLLAFLDQMAVIFGALNSGSKKGKTKEEKYRSYKNFDQKEFNKDVDQVPHHAAYVLTISMTFTGRMRSYLRTLLINMH